MKRFSLKNKLSIVLSTGLLSGVPLLPLFTFAGTTKNIWQCKAGPEGKWLCERVIKNTGPVFDAKSLPVDPFEKNKNTHTSGNEKKVVGVKRKIKKEKTLNVSPSMLDWVSIDKLPASFPLTKRVFLCEGAYVEPDWPGRYFKGDANNAPIKANADTYNYQTKGDGVLKGHVQIEQGNRLIKSLSADLDKEKNLALFKGNVVIRQPNILVLGRRGYMNTKTNDAHIVDAKYVLQKQHIRGTAAYAERNSAGVVKLRQATYTTAPPGSNAWIFSADKMTLNPESGRGEAHDAVLRVSDIPVFYTPYINFPIDSRRKTGLLYPALSVGGDNGAEYIQPFYMNIAPNLDDTLTPRLMSERGIMLSNQFRYRFSDLDGELGGSILGNKDPVKNDNPFYDRSRWLLFWKHQQRLAENWAVEVNYNKASDKNFIHDFGVNDWSFERTDPLSQEISTLYQGSVETDHPWSLSVRAQRFQNMSLSANDPYNRLPEATLKGSWLLTNELSTFYMLDYTRFERSRDWRFSGTETIDSDNGIYRYSYSPGSGLNNAKGSRLVMQGGLKHRVDHTYGFWESGIKYRGVVYNLNNLDLTQVQSQLLDTTLDKDTIEHPETFAPTLYSGGGLYFDRHFSFLKNSFTQTLEPRIQYVYTPYIKNQKRNPVFDTGAISFNINSLWDTDRFGGYDRTGDTNHVSLGLTSRILDERGVETFRFGIGQSFYLQDRKVLLDPTLIENDKTDSSNRDQAKQRLLDNYRSPVSPVATQIVWSPWPNWSVQQDYIYNTRYHYTDQYHLGVGWQSANNQVFNVGYRYISEPDRVVYTREGNATAKYTNGDLNTVETSFALPLLPGNACGSWQMLGLWSYDIANNRDLTRMMGVQKDTCSYRVRLVFRSYVDPSLHVEAAKEKHGMFLQFMLKGLGNITGSQTDTYLNEINGYKPEYDDDK